MSAATEHKVHSKSRIQWNLPMKDTSIGTSHFVHCNDVLSRDVVCPSSRRVLYLGAPLGLGLGLGLGLLHTLGLSAIGIEL